MLHRMVLGLHQHVQTQHRLQRRRVRETNPLRTRRRHTKDDRHTTIIAQRPAAEPRPAIDQHTPPPPLPTSTAAPHTAKRNAAAPRLRGTRETIEADEAQASAAEWLAPSTLLLPRKVAGSL